MNQSGWLLALVDKVGLMAFHMIKDEALQIFLYISLKIRKINALWGGENIPPPTPQTFLSIDDAAPHHTICYVKCQPIKLNCPPGTPPSPTHLLNITHFLLFILQSSTIQYCRNWMFSVLWPFSRNHRGCVGRFLFVYIFGGLECVGHSFTYVAQFVFLEDVWMRTHRAAVASGRATNLVTYYLPIGRISGRPSWWIILDKFWKRLFHVL